MYEGLKGIVNHFALLLHGMLQVLFFNTIVRTEASLMMSNKKLLTKE